MGHTKSAPACGCPVAAFQKMISGKYKLRIVWDLQDGPKRYGEIRTGLLRGSDGTSEIAPRVLSRELKALTETGLIDRKDYGVVPPKVEYRLTARARVLCPSSLPFAIGGRATSPRRKWLKWSRPNSFTCYIAPVRNGLVIRSWPMLEPGPWPQMKPISSPSGNSLSLIDWISVA
jgi:DNA-binding HxlR family transcriptional regulator